MLEDPVETSRDMGKHVSRPAVHAIRLEAARAILEISAGGFDAAGAAVAPVAAADGGTTDAAPLGGFSFLDGGRDWRLQEHRDLLGAARVSSLLPVPRVGVMDVRLVTDSAGCAEMVSALDGKSVIALDCEGESLSRTGRLCLVQLAAQGTRDGGRN